VALSEGRERFPKRARLTKRSEFLRLSREGKKVTTPHFIVICKANDRKLNRLGVTVSAKVGGAVVRNRIKRLLREFFRTRQNSLLVQRDLLVIARKGAGELSQAELTRELEEAFTRP